MLVLLITIISGCRVRTTTERLSQQGFNSPPKQTVTTDTALINNSNNNSQPQNNNNNNNSNIDSDPPVDIPVSNPPANSGRDSRSNNPQTDDDIRVTIPKLFIKIFARKVPESSSTVGLLSFGILSSIYLYAKKKGREKH
jgi:hypothetical protein